MQVKVLVVDDAADIRNLLTRILNRAEFQVVCGHNGCEAVQVAEREHPDLVLMDLAMPGMDGYQTARRIRAIPALEDVPILALSADVEAAASDPIFTTGLLKPFELGQLVALVHFHTGGRIQRASACSPG